MLKIFNIGKANQEIEAAASALAPALAKANINTIPVDGKPVPAAAAPLASQISALLAVAPTASGSQNEAELLVTNSTLAAQLEKVTGEHAVAQATVGTLQGQVRELTTRSENAEASVATLTAEKGQMNVQLEAAKTEFTRVSREQAAFNTELSKACLAIGCLQLTDAAGVALPRTASEEQKLEAANRISASEKLKSYQGGLNLAMANLGLSASSIPGGPVKLTSTATGIIAQYEAEKAKGAAEGVAFYRKNAEAIDAAYSAKAARK